MPTYEYRCKDCNHQFEKLQPIKDFPLEICPQCGGKIKRMITGGSGMIFKGTGFYITDYKKNTTPTDSKCETSASPQNGSGSTPSSGEASKNSQVPPIPTSSKKS